MPPATRLVFLGTGDFALPTFLHLHEKGFSILALVTQPDRPQGRKQEVLPSRIKVAAVERGIRVEQPEDVNSAKGLALIRELAPDLLVTAAYGQILSAQMLEIPPLGGINLHGSILPAYRGAAPVARAIQNGETETGVTVIQMTPQVDAGGILAIARTPIEPDETAGQLEERLAVLGAPLVAAAIEALAAGSARRIRQERSRATKAPKLTKDDGRIQWSRTALEIHNLVRAMQPWPTAQTLWHPSIEGKSPVRLIVHQTAVIPMPASSEPAAVPAPGRVITAGTDRLVVEAGQGAVELLKVQVPGKRILTAAEFLRGHRVQTGDMMGD